MILEQDFRAQNTICNEKSRLIMHRQVPRHAVNADGGWQVFRRNYGGRDCGSLITPVSFIFVLIAVTRTSHFRYVTYFLLPRGPEIAGDMHAQSRLETGWVCTR